ncbi:MAG TPA: PaaI family thioesterase [Flavobacteriales bacterium]|jgi:uncharacterized protein (TIGR00369 family)|nr:PaaI family thioesterase [Flavobacteriales bacterium]
MHPILQLYNSINQFGISNNLKLKVLEPGSIEYQMKVLPGHLATPIAIHGGVLAALMDAVLGVAALSLTCQENKLVSTVEFKINYLAPAEPGDSLLAEGKVLKPGNRLIIAEGLIRNPERDLLIAKGLGSFYAYPIKKSGFLEKLSPEQRKILNKG